MLRIGAIGQGLLLQMRLLRSFETGGTRTVELRKNVPTALALLVLILCWNSDCRLVDVAPQGPDPNTHEEGLDQISDHLTVPIDGDMISTRVQEQNLGSLLARSCSPALKVSVFYRTALHGSSS